MRKRALVIDDDAQARALVAASLESKGYEVRGATGGVKGLTLRGAGLRAQAFPEGQPHRPHRGSAGGQAPREPAAGR
jgi:CheY-like chemotaxis protein